MRRLATVLAIALLLAASLGLAGCREPTEAGRPQPMREVDDPRDIIEDKEPAEAGEPMHRQDILSVEPGGSPGEDDLSLAQKYRLPGTDSGYLASKARQRN